MEFMNPSNGYSERVSGLAILWAALGGALYFILRGAWRYAILWIVFVPLGTYLLIGVVFATGASRQPGIDGQLLAVAVLLGPHLLFALAAPGMLRRHYLRKGWRQVGGGSGDQTFHGTQHY